MGIRNGVRMPTQFSEYWAPVMPIQKALLPGQSMSWWRLFSDSQSPSEGYYMYHRPTCLLESVNPLSSWHQKDSKGWYMNPLLKIHRYQCHNQGIDLHKDWSGLRSDHVGTRKPEKAGTKYTLRGTTTDPPAFCNQFTPQSRRQLFRIGVADLIN